MMPTAARYATPDSLTPRFGRDIRSIVLGLVTGTQSIISSNKQTPHPLFRTHVRLRTGGFFSDAFAIFHFWVACLKFCKMISDFSIFGFRVGFLVSEGQLRGQS